LRKNNKFKLIIQLITPNNKNNMMQPHTRIPYHQKPRVVFVLGGPGSGKGTQSKFIQK